MRTGVYYTALIFDAAFRGEDIESISDSMTGRLYIKLLLEVFKFKHQAF